MKKFILFLILLFTIPLHSQVTQKENNTNPKDEKMRIAVMDFEAKGIPKGDALKLTDIIRNDIVNTGKFIVIERSQMGQIIKEQGFQQTGCTDVSCAVELGKILSAKKILVGSIIAIEGQFVITGRIVDVENGIVDFSEKAVASNKNEIITAVSAFVEKLSDRIGYKNTVNIADNNESKKAAVEKEKNKSANPSESNPYTINMIISLSFTGAFMGGGYYYDTQVTSKADSLNTLYKQYSSATDPDAITSIKNKMKSEQENSDKYALYRNISYGLGGVSVLFSVYYIYNFLTYTPTGYSSNYQKENILTIYPIITVFNLSNTYNSDETFYGCGVNFKF